MKSKKGKTIQKISVIAALVALICMALAISVMADETTGVKGDSCTTYGDINDDGMISEHDAIYLLYHSVFPEEYPLDEGLDVDFTEDEVISGKDALKLWELIGLEELQGEVHGYPEPVWTWNLTQDGDVVSVTAYFKCACGAKSQAVVIEAGQIEVVDEIIATSCIEASKITYRVTAEYDGVTYDTTKTYSIPATGHSFAEGLKACQEHVCQNPDCGYVEPAEAHILGAEPREVVVNEALHQYKEVYTCTVCGTDVDGETYEKHKYTSKITTEADCHNPGVKTYTCSCGASYTEEIPAVADAHIWSENGTPGNGVVTYDCTVAGCDQIRTVIDASTETETTVSKDALDKDVEVALKDAAIKMDEATIEQLPEDVKISAEKTTVDAIVNLDGSLAAQIGDKPVYNLTMKDGNNNSVSEFAGMVTVTIPYELTAEDDADCIDVWYIDEDGNEEIVRGTYNNGYVTFTTNHFSYYTVTRLTPEQRCAEYGCENKKTVVPATCVTDGYTLNVCIRCGEKTINNVVKATGHDSDIQHKEATCTENGYHKEDCNVCDYSVDKVFVATGHELESTKVDATCTTRGYTLYECKNCDHEEKEYEAAELGHDYEAVWTWDKDALTADLHLECQTEGCGDSVEKSGIVSVEKQVAATCEEDGSILYVAQTKHNGLVYSDKYTALEPKHGHKASYEWQHNSSNHYKVCIWCNARMSEADHEFEDGDIIKAPTCTEAGERKAVCSCGYETTVAVAALGHDLVNGSCTRCDFTTITCDHDKTHMVEVDLEKAGGCEGYFVYKTCECGQYQSLSFYDMRCDFEGEEEITVDENGYEVYHVDAVCKDCGLHYVETSDWEVLSGCIGNCYMRATLTDKNGNVLADFDGYGAENVEHPRAIRGESVDLSEYGLCGEILTYSECPCGEIETVGIKSTCKWAYVESESIGTTNVFVCEECGARRETESDGEMIDDCHYLTINHLVYYFDGEEIGHFTQENMEVYHDSDYTFELEGDTCADGYFVTEECKYCDNVTRYYEKPEADVHYTYYQLVDVSEYDLCTDLADAWGCPCGDYCESGLSYNCFWSLVDYDEVEEGNTTIATAVMECTECGLTYESVETWIKTDNPCVTKYDYVCTYKVGSEVIFEEHTFNDLVDHDYMILSYPLDGNSCEDGGIILMECKVCGQVSEEYIWGHTTFELASYDLAEFGFCGGTVSLESCACGEYSYINENAEEGEECCEWMWWSYDSETGATKDKCLKCGMYREYIYREENLENCEAKYTQRYDYMNEYDVLFSLKSVQLGYNHNYAYEYTLNGSTCWEGYYVAATCKDCGFANSWYSQSEYGCHDHMTVEEHNLSEFGLCGGEIWKYECPCGAESGWNWNTDCNWSWYDYDEENDVDIYKCMDCGAYRAFESRFISKDGCEEMYHTAHVFYDSEMNVVFTAEDTVVEEYHNNTYVFTLEGTTCSDGYMVSEVCKDCGYTQTNHMVPPVGEHPVYEVERYDMAELGMCTGTVSRYQCPCGEDGHYSQNMSCNWEYQNGGMGYSEWICTECGATKTSNQVSREPEGCYIPLVTTTTIANANEETVLSYEEITRFDNHVYEVTGFQLNGESCFDGYIEYLACKNCGMTTFYEGYEHNMHAVNEYDLSPYGVCEGTEIGYYACYCGSETYLNYNIYESCSIERDINEYVDTDGIVHYVEIMTCSDCGLMVTENIAYVVDEANCMADVTYQYTITVGEQAVDAISFAKKEAYHNYVEVLELVEGATSCDEGVIVTTICNGCGDSWSNIEYGHKALEVAGADGCIDLSQYGSVCGGYLKHVACICGEYDNYDFDTECDLDYSSIDPWLGEDYDDQKTTEGWVYANRYANEIRCAVTDPQCGLVMRECRYFVWDEANCSMQEYFVYQIGYDAATDTCQKEVVITGECFAYHNYESSVLEEDNAVGGKDRSIIDTCTTCGSSRTVKYGYDANNNQYLTDETITNTLDNGEAIYYNLYSEDIFKNSASYEVMDSHRVDYADGSAYWYSYEYIYDWDNFDCTRIYRYNSSNGESNERVEDCHVGTSQYVSEKTPTCTQFGKHHYEMICNACGTNVITSEHNTTPTCHDFVMIGDIYTCADCGLQSENGANGSIVLEDMTDAYGNNTNYVIGYFNRSGYQFNYYVSVVTDSNEVILHDITLTELKTSTDGINAISFSKAEVAAAMEAAGVTDGDIRLTFAPADAGFDLDYAITLTK